MEVKSRIDNRCGTPSEAVNYYKARHIYRVAEFFLMLNRLENTYARFDVIEVYGKNNKIHINHIKNAILDRPNKF